MLNCGYEIKYDPRSYERKSIAKVSQVSQEHRYARASYRYREVTGSHPVEVLNFSGFSTQLLKKIAFITARIIASLQRQLVAKNFSRWQISKENIKIKWRKWIQTRVYKMKVNFTIQRKNLQRNDGFKINDTLRTFTNLSRSVWEEACPLSWVGPSAFSLGPYSRPRARLFSIKLRPFLNK